VASRSAVVVEKSSDHTGGFFCPACRDEMFLGLPRRDGVKKPRSRSFVASVRGAVRGLLLKIPGVKFRLRRKPR
jgi:hypothetical protein